MKIITITLNPAFDVHCNIENMQLYKENYVSSFVKHAGGKGINISRALTSFGVENTALCVLGKSGAEEFLTGVKNESVACIPIMADGRIRENITIHSSGKETRISFEGFSIDKEILDSVYKTIETEKCDDLLITFTGRLCKGITTRAAIEMLKRIKSLGAKLIVDCNSFRLEDLAELKPFLIKPNEQEISDLMGYDIKTVDDAVAAVSKLNGHCAENIIVSLGDKGFVYGGMNGIFNITVPQISPVSTIGAGDSLIAGFVAGMSMKADTDETLKLAASFGTAACMTEGTTPPDKADIVNLKNEIEINNCI